MNMYLCSISFRHELVSFGELIDYAAAAGFDGIELWGVHGRALLRSRPQELPRMLDDMNARGLGISMVSDYADLLAPDDRLPELLQRWEELLDMAQAFRTRHIRLFAGSRPSVAADERDWSRCAERLRELARIAAEQGVSIVIETHPDTLADTLQSTLRLLRDTNHSHVRINLDFLHLWESGTAPLEAYRALSEWTVNFHVKNVASPDHVELFAPVNVFSPSGRRTGMTGLSSGAIDYSAVFDRLCRDGVQHPVAIEWFGEQPYQHLRSELQWAAAWNS
ncbi:sugar phosphate isomerase/epimerase family protein [Cohnella sp. 56]|uniref:sugar phosphate isomerase/epimerase family protein n=1 Tax=Cohnella sp. 56 TaxID=3113722 RepID=UPI0030E7E2DC